MNEHEDHNAHNEQSQQHDACEDHTDHDADGVESGHDSHDTQETPSESEATSHSQQSGESVQVDTSEVSEVDTGTHLDDAAGEEMIAILEDVEAQFQKLRNVQQSNDAMISSLSDRARSLSEAESELANERDGLLSKLNHFEEDRAALEKEHQHNTEKYQLDRQALSEDKLSFDQHQTTANEELKKTQSELEAAQADVEERSITLTKQHEEVKAQASELESESKALNKRSEMLAAQARELGDTAQKIAEADRTISTLNETLEATTSKNEEEVKSLSSQKAALVEKIQSGKSKRTHLREQLALSESNVSDLQQKFNERCAQIDELDSCVDSLKESLKHNQEQATASEHDALEIIGNLEADRDTAKENLASLQAAHTEKTEETQTLTLQCAELTGRIEKLQTHLSERESRLEDNQSKLRVAGEKLTHFAESLKGQGPLLERGAAAMAMVEEQSRQIKSLTGEVAQLKVQGSPDELIKKDERIKSLTEALRQARGQTAGQQDLDALEQSNASLCEELESTKITLHETQIELEQVETTLANRTDDSGSTQVHESRVAELEAMHAAIKTKLDEATATEQAARSRYEDQIKTLEEELDLVNSTAKCTEGSESGMVKELRDKAQRINGVAVHLRRRRQRLGKVRQLLESSAQASSPTGTVDFEKHSQQLRSIEDQRQQLTELRTVLESSERKMIRRWAHSRAVFACLWLLVIATAIAGVSWAATDHFHPALRSAAVTLKAKGTTHTKLDADQNATWASWHKDLLKNENFTRTLARRMGDRRFEEYRTPQGVADRIARDLTVDSSVPGELALTLVGTAPGETEAFLNLLTATVIAESARNTGKHPDGAKAIAPHQISDGTGIRYASLNPTPVADERLVKALPIFGGALAGAILLIALIYTWLSRAKRVFDEADPVSEYEEMNIQTT